MKKKVKIQFVDFWHGFIKTDNFFINLLSKHFVVELSDKPDYLIYSCYGFAHLNYDCYKIFYNGENIRVNWNACDFAISSDYLDDERYYRLPHWILYGDLNSLIKNNIDPRIILKEKTGFCCFIVGNPNAKKRIDFFYKLSKYKQVDSGGSLMNNVGKVYSQLNKMEFVKKYKFTIAFENSSYPGYTTEKIFQAMLGNTIPIYWGDPMVGKDFNTSGFINFSDYKSDEEIIEKIIELDKDDEQYYKMISEPWYVNNKLPDSANMEKLAAFFEKIFSSYGKFTPVSKTGKRHIYRLQLNWGKANYILNSYLKYKKVFR
jgi:hypothetical protein